MREPICAGTYYQASETLLAEEIEGSYHADRGPGSTPLEKQEHKTLAIISPNSPYSHCGPCASWGYKEIAETPTADVYIIISANHHSTESGVTTETFITPLGMIRVDQELARGLVEKGTISYDDEIHNRDHGVEIQLPYLQFAKKKVVEKLKILPLIVSTDIDLKQLSLDIKEVLLEQNKNPIFIISTDFLRHGPMFHYVRYLEDAQKNIYEFDRRGIDIIKSLNSEGWYNYIDKNFAPIDGTVAIQLLLMLVKNCDVRLEQYYTSADILNEQKNSVSYAAIVFEEK